jgi:hypothetical protein
MLASPSALPVSSPCDKYRPRSVYGRLSWPQRLTKLLGIKSRDNGRVALAFFLLSFDQSQWTPASDMLGG